MMNKLLAKAERKALSVLRKEIAKREYTAFCKIRSYIADRCLHRFYLREFWKALYKVADDNFGKGNRDCRSVDELMNALHQTSPEKVVVKSLRAWAEVHLPHHVFRILESEDSLYIVASSMDGFPVTMSAKDLVSVLLAFDEYTATKDMDAMLEKTLIEVSAEKKATEMLTQTASLLIEDILKTEQFRFDVRMQKNGRLCCTIHKWASWMPNKVFRTSFETFREDFIEAYKDFKCRNSVCYYL
ncbi:MAG: hypothetical protein IKY48_06885 [Bacteroidales bacterium]|nr:hypothetical protein [Bacteroidales bacterium]